MPFIHHIQQKIEGNMTFHTARSTAYPQPAPGEGAGPGPLVVPAEQLRSAIGLTSVRIRDGGAPLAVTDTTLAQAQMQGRRCHRSPPLHRPHQP